MAVDDIVGIRIVGRYQDQNIVNTMHYKITAQVSTDNEILGVLGAAWLADHNSDWMDRHSDQYELVGVRCFSLTGDNKMPGIVPHGYAGNVVGVELPAMICRTVTLYTDSSNYRRRGRIMLSGTVVAQLVEADGSVTAAEMALMEALGSALIADIDSLGDSFTPGLAPNGVLPFEPFTGALGRKTPAGITSRRIRGFSIG